jgi:hypothetical protein
MDASTEFVSRVECSFDGDPEPNIKSFEEDDVELAKPVSAMHHTGFVAVTERFKFNIGYIVPADQKERNWRAIKSSTFSVVGEGGSQILFTGVRCLKIGKATYDMENEAVRTIEFGATDRKEI